MFWLYLKSREGSYIKLIILNLNPCFDHWVLLDTPPPIPHVLRGKKIVHQVGGKGLNIGRVFSHFDFEQYLCINILGGSVGRIIEEQCNEIGIHTKNFHVREESRIATAIVHHYGNRHDVQMLNEEGPTISKNELVDFKKFYLESIEQDDIVVISGSAPIGFSPEDLAELALISINRGVKLAVDIANEWLLEIVNQKIHVLKNNHDEIRIAFGINPHDVTVLDSLRKKYDIEYLIVTYGKNGAIALSDTSRYFVRPPNLKVDFAVGSGDSFFAGLLMKLFKGDNIKAALTCATACGAANASHYGAALFSIDDYHECLQNVEIEEVKREVLFGN